MLKNSTVRIILAAAVVVLIVAATFAYGNSQRQAQVKKNDQLAEQSTTTSETESPTVSATPSATTSPTPSASATPTPTVITPPNGITPETGGEWLIVLPATVLTVLGVARRNSARDTDAALRSSTDK